MQQQQQIQQLSSQPQQFNQNGQGHSDQNYYSQGYSNTQYRATLKTAISPECRQGTQ